MLALAGAARVWRAAARPSQGFRARKMH